MGPLGKDAGHLDSESKPLKDPSTILIIYILIISYMMYILIYY